MTQQEPHYRSNIIITETHLLSVNKLMLFVYDAIYIYISVLRIACELKSNFRSVLFTFLILDFSKLKLGIKVFFLKR